jgi:N-acetylglucosaminyldiphosphoundecaprenol N-acetyl-beta-D-mannosaminyltransferase
MDRVNIFGVFVDPVCLLDVLELIRQAVSTGRRTLITHVNVRGLNIAYEQEWYRSFLNGSDLVYCDGMGVQVGARLLGCRIPERFTLADWVYPLAEMCAKEGFSLYLLGNPPGVPERAAVSLQARYPHLRIAGTQHGYFDKSSSQPDNQAVVERINLARPDILLVGFGMPLQEKWLLENWSRLGACVAISCGALFEYVAGDLPRGPAWMTQYYLEWLARVILSPGRYGWRYLRDGPLFLARILRTRLSETAKT